MRQQFRTEIYGNCGNYISRNDAANSAEIAGIPGTLPPGKIVYGPSSTSLVKEN